VLQAHSHNYQRTYPIKFNDKDASNPVITDENGGEYTNSKGTLFAVIGTADADLHNFTGQAPYVVKHSKGLVSLWENQLLISILKFWIWNTF
jgi:hypothetical protein